MLLRDIAKLVQQKRLTLGLSQAQLARLTELSRQTIVALEAGTLQELGVSRLEKVFTVLGLVLGAGEGESQRSGKTHPRVLAARSASTSYREVMSSAVLGRAMVEGRIPPEYTAHVATLLSELSPQLLARTVQATAQEYDLPPKKLWKTLSRWSHDLQTTRPF